MLSSFTVHTPKQHFVFITYFDYRSAKSINPYFVPVPVFQKKVGPDPEPGVRELYGYGNYTGLGHQDPGPDSVFFIKYSISIIKILETFLNVFIN
jgi:hypothetical protein